MELHEQHCWEYKGGCLVSIDDPADGDGDVDQNIFAAGYLHEITSKYVKSHSGADVTVYKNTSPTNEKPLFYIDIMGDKTGIAALIARDFKKLVETLNYLSGLLNLIRMDQSSTIGNLIIQSKEPRP
jgi:hypothetical protein